MQVRKMAQAQWVSNRRSFCRREGLFGGSIVVLGLALIWAARMVTAIHAPPPMLEFISAGELEG
jgi:hypothetical protein